MGDQVCRPPRAPSAHHLLVHVSTLAGWVGMVQGLDAPGVDASQIGALLAARGLAGERIGGVLKHTLEPPFAEVIEHGQPQGEVLGEHTPLATDLDYVKYCAHYPAESMFHFPFLRIYDFFYNLSLIISKVGMNTSS